MSKDKIVTFRLEDLPRITCEEAERIWQATPPIDYSDIPELTDEWFERAIAAREKRKQAERDREI